MRAYDLLCLMAEPLKRMSKVGHVQNAIMDYYDVDCGSEEAAYLQGYIMRRIIRVLKIDGQILD